MLGFSPQRRMRSATPFRPVQMLVLICALAALALFAPGAGAAPGDLDTGYNSTGTRIDDLTPYDDAGHGVAVQPDGKVVVVGGGTPTAGYGAFTIMRFTAAGALDTTFGGGDGIVVQATGVDGGGTSVALQPDGKIVAGGTYWSRTGLAMEMYSFMRFNADGTLDTSFGGGDGEAQIALGSWGDYMQAIAVQPDGKIVGTGISTTGSAGVAGYSTARMGTVRINSDGTPDVLFGNNGVVITSVAGNYNKSRALAIQPDGKIVIGGDLNNPDDGFDDFALVRYTTSGALDTTFSSDGMQIVKFNALHDSIHALALQPDGKIVAGGFANNEQSFAVARLTSAGALDTTFNTTGMVTTNIAGTVNAGGVNAIDVQQNGRIVAGGFANNASRFTFAVARYTSTGALDTTFSTDGMNTTDVGGSGANGNGWNCDQTAPECPGIHGMAIQNTGAIFAAGARYSGTYNDTYTARYQGDSVTLPTVSITSPTASSTVGSTITPAFTATATGSVGIAQTICQLDTATPYLCTSGTAVNNLAPGAHTFKVTATDRAGISNTANVSFTTAALPVVSVTVPTEGQVLTGSSVNATFSSTSSTTQTVTCQLDSGTVASGCTSPRALSGLAAGPHTFTVASTNSTGTTTVVRNFSVQDTTAPTAPSSVSASSVTTTSATINWTAATDNVAVTGYDVLRNGSVVGSTTGAVTYAMTGLTCGTSYSIQIRAKDAAGNSSPNSSTYTLNTANCSAPTVTITSPTAGVELPGATTSVTVNFTLSGTAPTSTTCKLDNQTAVACSSSTSHTFTGVGQGPHTITVTGVHTTWGNGSASVSFSITDTIDPSIPDKALFTTTNRTLTSATLNWTAQTDNVGVVSYYIYDSVTSDPVGEKLVTDPNPLSINVTGLTCGVSKWVRVAAVDAAGHWGLSDAYELKPLDCPTAPVVTITSPANNATVSGNSPSIVFTATQDPTSVTCALDSGSATACTSPRAYSSLTPGAHSVTVTATNALGSGSAIVNFTVPDNEIPTAPGAPSISAITTTGATATWAASIDNVGVTAYDVYLNGTLKGTTAATSLAMTGLTCNTHYDVTVRAKDGSGNTSPISTATGFDTSACPGPTVTITSPTAGAELPGTTTSVSVAFTIANGPATTTTCKLDGGAAVACVSGQSFAISNQGPHTIQVTVSNANGTNQSVVAFSVADTIDPATPNKATFTTTNRTLTSATLNWPAISDNVGVVRYYVFNADTSLAIGETAVTDPNPLSLNITGLTCGTSTWIKLAAIDAADHWGISDAYEVTTLPCPTAPVVTITSPTNNSTLAGYNASIVFSATQNPTSVTCSLDGGAASTCTSPQAYNGLTPGAHNVTVSATNDLGSDSKTVNFTVPDITAPTAPGTPSASAITATGATLSWTAATDNVAVTAYEVYVGGTLRGTTAAGSLAVTGLTCNTTYSAYVRAKDAAGNGTNGTSAPFQTSVCPGPTVTISTPTAGQELPGTTTSVAPTFTVANGPATTTTCSLDNATPVNCISGQSFAIAAQGPHTFQVTVTNANGTNSQVVNFSVADTIDPATPNKSTFTTTNRTLTSATLNWPVVSDNVGVVRYFVFNADTSVPIGEKLVTDPQPLQLDITGLTCGTSTWVKLAAIDAADHWGISDAYEVTTLPCPTAPVVTITSPVNNSTLAGYSASVAFTATQDPTSVTCALDGGSASACTSPQAYSSLTPGAHSVVVTATNSQGAGSATVNFTVPDITAPTAPGQPNAGSITATGATLSWVAATDNVGVTAYEVYAGGTLRGTTATTSLAISGLTCNTTYPIYIRAKDAAGNATNSTTGSLQTSVCPGPTVTITSPTPAQVFPGSTTSVSVTFSVANGPATTTTCKLDSAAAVPCASGDSFAIAAQGPHSLQVTVTNVNGTNSQVVNFSLTDTIDPATPDKALFTTTNRTLTSATLNWPAGTDNVGVVRYYVFNADTSVPIGEKLVTDPQPLQLDITGLTCGTSTWVKLAAIDAADHWGISDAYEVTTLPCPTAPVVTITSPTNGATLAGYSTSVAFTATQNPDTITCALDGAVAAACTSPQAYSSLTPGAHTVTVTATNTIGSTSATVNFTVPDITAPTTPGQPAISNITPTSATASWVASSDNVGVTGYDVYVGGTLKGSTTGATTFALTGLTCGTSQSVTVRAKDAAGNVSSASTAGTFNTSVCPGPTVTITSPTPAQVFPGSTTSVSVTFSVANGPATTTTCKLDSAAAVPCSSGDSFAIAAQGPHSIQVTVTNVNGTNSQVVNFSVADTIDPATPNKDLFTTTNRTLTSATLNWPAGTDNVGVVRYYVFNADTSVAIGEKLATDPQPLQLDITGLTCGTSTWVKLAAIDAADHWGISDAYEVTTLPCPTAPVVTITSPVNNSTLAGYSTSVAFTATQDPTSATCALDSGAATACTSPQAYSSLAPGAHTVTVTATNAIGSTSQTVNFTVPDITAPTTPGQPAISAITATTATATWTASTDNVGVTGYDVYVGATLKGSTTGATTFALTGLTCGASQSVTIRAKDAAGNVSSASTAGTFNTSVCPGPTVTITSPTAAPELPGTTTSVTVNFTVANGPATTTTCKLDSAAAVPCVSGDSFAITAQGPHSIQVTVSNVNGTNSSVVNFSVADTIDPATPNKNLFTTTNRTLTSATLNWPAGTDNVGVVRYYVFNADTSVAIGEKLATDPQPLQLDITGLTCGTSTWVKLAAIDAADHWGISDAYEVTTLPCPTAPVVTITSPVNNSTLAGYSTSVAFTATQDPTSVTCTLDGGSASACTSPQAYSSLAPGAHVVAVTAVNPQGSTTATVNFTVPDITAPTTPGQPAISAIAPTTATATWTASTDNVAVTGYDVYVGATLKGSTTGATTFALTGLTCGTSQSVTVRAKDAAGNISSASTAGTFNTTACPGPVPTITSPTAGVELPGTTTSVPVTFTVASSGETVTSTCKLDSAAAVPCDTATSHTFNGVGQGPHTVTVTSTSVYGTNSASVAFSITDTVDPSTPDKSTFVISGITRTGATVTWPAQTDNVGIERYLVLDIDWNVLADKPTSGPNPLSHTLTGLTCGTTTWYRIVAVDAANHWGTSDLFDVTTSPCMTIPVVTISSPADGAVIAGGSTSVSFTATQEADSFTCKLDGAAPEACTSPKSYSGLAEGPHTILISATNTTGTGTKAITVNVPDTVAPTAPTNLSSSAITGTSATLNWTAGTDNVAVTGYDIYNGAAKIGSSATTSFTATGLTCGTQYTLTVKAKDAAGLESPASAGHTFTTGDCNVPTVAITTPEPDQKFNTGSFSVAFIVTGAGTVSGKTCKVDAQTPIACESGDLISGLTQGPHTLVVSATSEWGTGSATVAFSVKDTTPPSAPTNLQVVTRTLTSVTLSWTASTDNVQVGGYAVTDPVTGDYLGYSTTPSMVLTGPLAEPWQCGQSHWVRVTAEDVETPTHNYTQSQDLQVSTLPCLTAPNITVTSPANSSTPLATNSFVLGATVTGNPVPTLKCSLDNAVAADCTLGQVFSDLSYGAHTLTVTATNSQGVAASTVNFVAPDAVAPSKPAGLGHTTPTVSSSTVSWTASTDNVGVTGYDVYVDGTLKGSTTGATSFAVTGLTCATTYQVTVQAKDARGNLSQFSDAHGVTTADCPPPSITSAEATVSGRNVSLAFTVTGQTTSISCKLDTGSTGACTSPKSYTGLSAGPHSVLITATHTQWGTDTETVNFTVVDQLPTAPFNVAASGVSQTGFTIGWQAATDDFGVSGYDVYIDGAKVGSTNPTTRTFAVTGLTCGTDHTIVIHAIDSANQERASDEVLFATTACDVPGGGGSGGSGGGGGAGGGGSTPPPAAPAITSIPKTAKATKRVKIGLSCPGGCTLAVKVKIGKKSYKVPTVKVASGATYTYLKASGSLLKKIKKGLKKKQKVTVTVTPSSSAGKGASKSYKLKK